MIVYKFIPLRGHQMLIGFSIPIKVFQLLIFLVIGFKI
jgi:hypothetical protein